MQAMRSRLMAYTRGMHSARPLRSALSSVASLTELDVIIERHLQDIPDDTALLVS
jgi:hypothetical protein